MGSIVVQLCLLMQHPEAILNNGIFHSNLEVEFINKLLTRSQEVECISEFDNEVHDLVSVKPTIHEATFVAGDKTTLSFVPAVHEISHGTFYKSLGNRRAVYSQATCRM